MRFEDSDDARLRIVPRKGVARGVSRERVPWISFYEDVQIFLSTPFETLPDQKISGSNRTDKSENSEKFPPGVFTPAWNPEYVRTDR